MPTPMSRYASKRKIHAQRRAGRGEVGGVARVVEEGGALAGAKHDEGKQRAAKQGAEKHDLPAGKRDLACNDAVRAKDEQ